MGVKELWLGLVSFSVGVVLMFNLGQLLSSAKLYVTIPVEIIVAILIFGGILLMIMNVKKEKLTGFDKQPKMSKV